ncbi:hypothetical protein F5Y09DRAFT_135827 [Xylaria sp. FL1042]|nr:hypothetical protein F5Y09DRAFT_135827 [Xylaria sp. FL1042]
MQANLFEILAIASAFSAVHSAPVETAEGQVAQGQVNGTQANKAHTNETQVSNKVRACFGISSNSYNAFYPVSEGLTPKISLFISCKLAIRKEMFLSASKREREISSRVLAGIRAAGWTLNVSHGDVVG